MCSRPVPCRQCEQPATLNKSGTKSDKNSSVAKQKQSCPDHTPHPRASRVKTRPLAPTWHPHTCSPPRLERLPAAEEKSTGVVRVAPKSTRQPRGSVPMERSRECEGGARGEAWAELTWWPRIEHAAAVARQQLASDHLHERRVSQRLGTWHNGSPGLSSPAARALRSSPGGESDARPRTPPQGCGRPEIRGVSGTTPTM